MTASDQRLAAAQSQYPGWSGLRKISPKIFVFGLVLLPFFTNCAPMRSRPLIVPPGTREALASQIAIPDENAQPAPTSTRSNLLAEPLITLTPSPTPRTAFRITPAEPLGDASFMTDRSSAALAEEKRTIGDYFEGNLFERPMAKNSLRYRPHLDIYPGAELSLDPPWIYFTIHLVNSPYSWIESHYGIEIDQDFDGRGDLLIVSSFPESLEWTRENVYIYVDSNDDVGGSDPMQSDEEPGDGYDTLIFGEVTGLDPDIAWLRRHPRDETSLQFAIKQSLLDRGWHFAWGAWAIGGELHPDQFDFNDIYTLEEAGSPLGHSKYYPPLAFVEIDNTCRSIAGAAPSGPIPGLCPMARPTALPTPVPTNTPAP